MSRKTEGDGGLTLYRGETPGAVGLDIYGRYGQHWATDFEHALCYARGSEGYVKKAILPETANRLVLVTSNEEGYSEINWQAVDRLQALTDFPYLQKTVQNWPLYEIWCVEWTVALVAAGYDSIASEGLDGPEEYVLRPDTLIQVATIYPSQLQLHERFLHD